MNVHQANKIILEPYSTEKTSIMVEHEGKLCFIVDRAANKPEIIQAIELLYEQKVSKVNTAITIRGKKAFVKFENVEKANDLARQIGML